MKPLLSSTVGFLTLAVIGCGPTNQNVIDQYKPHFETKRAQFKKIAGLLPAVGSVKKNSGHTQLEPKPHSDRVGKESNTEILMVEQLADPDILLRSPEEVDLLLSGDLLTCMRWTGPKNPMAESVRRQSAANLCSSAEFDRILAYSYLVVLRVVNYRKPEVLTLKTYIEGTVELEGFLVDLRSDKIVASFHVKAQSDPKVDYQVMGKEDPVRKAEGFAYSTLWVNARKKVAEALVEMTGGTFATEKR